MRLFWIISLLIATKKFAWGISIKDKKPLKLLRLAEQAMEDSDDRSPVIVLTSSDYKDFVLQKPRHYHLFLLFTASAADCQICGNFENGWNQAALSFFYSQTNITFDSHPVFFARADVYKLENVAKMHNLRHLPVMAHIEEATFDKEKSGSDRSFKERDILNVESLTTIAEEILKWANEKSNRDVTVYRSMHEKILMALKTGFIFLCLAILAVMLIAIVQRFPVICCFLALAVQFVSSSGLFYNVLQGLVMHGYERDGTKKWIMPEMRSQYLGEGLAMSLCQVLAGSALWCCIQIPTTAWGQTSKKLGFLLAGLLLIVWLCIHCVFHCYSLKSGWYRPPPFFPEESARSGALRNDQGNTF